MMLKPKMLARLGAHLSIRHFTIAPGLRQLLTIQEVKEQLGAYLGAEKHYSPEVPNRSHLVDLLPSSQEELPPRRMQDSFGQCIIPLGSNADYRQRYLNFQGGVRVGVILEDIDLFAVWLCYKHILLPKQQPEQQSPMTIVTALVDTITFGRQAFESTQNIHMQGHVSWVGKSSIEATLSLEQTLSDKRRKVMDACFVMVARNPVTSGRTFINPLIVEGQEEQAIFEKGNSNRLERQTWASQSLLKVPPNQEEREILHSLFMETVDPNSHAFEMRLCPEGCRWMETAVLENVIICQPQERNIYNKMFGGFLMRKAFELASSLTYLYSGRRPQILMMDNIWFRKPVEIGSLLHLTSQIVYVEGRDMQLRVHASVMYPETRLEDTTNIFQFTFTSPDSGEVQRVIPKSYNEAMMYLDGKRHYELYKEQRQQSTQ